MVNSVTEKPFKLKNKIDRMKQDRDKAKGGLSQVMQQIETEFECSDLDEAERVTREIRKDLKKTKRRIVKEHERLEDELAKHEQED
jgi:hypothetical protein